MKKTSTTAILSGVVAGVLAASLFAGPAAAQEQEELSFSYTVDRAQIATPEGAADAYRDLVAAAREACHVPAPGLVSAGRVDHRCAADLVAKVIEAAKAPGLAQRHAEISGAPAPAPQVASAFRG